MTTITFTSTPVAGDARTVAPLVARDVDIKTVIEGQLDANNLGATTAAYLGLSQTASVRRGKTIIATSESRTNTAYGTLTTPDEVTGIVVPTDGLLVVSYKATWQESVDAAARAAIFIGSNQLKIPDASQTTPQVQEAVCAGQGGIAQVLTSSSYGLAGRVGSSAASYTGDVTTGMALAYDQGAIGGPCYIYGLTAGTYTVSVQFKSSSGSVTVSNRKLWVESRSY